MAALEELTLTFCREKIRWDEVAILECTDPARIDTPGLQIVRGVIVKATCPPNDLVYGLSYRFYGQWVRHAKWGNQFVAQTYVRCQPHGKAGVIAYLLNMCGGYGLGRATADRLWERFGGDAVKILRESPAVAVAAVSAAGLSHFSLDKAEHCAAILAEDAALEGTLIDLVNLFTGRGFPRDLPKACILAWGNKAAALIQRNPYLLMRFKRVGFLRPDQLYLDQGGNPARLKRQALAAWYTIHSDSNGNTWHSPLVAEAGIRARVGGAAINPVKACRLAIRARLLAKERTAEGPWLAERHKAADEILVADAARRMLLELPRWPVMGDVADISEHQRLELTKGLQTSLSLFVGSPGTGKTYTLARLVGKTVGHWGTDAVAVCAPTGKAAVRVTEALQGYGVQQTATTIHRLLGVASMGGGEGWGFVHNESAPLEQRFIFIDEASMVNVGLLASLLRACGAHTHVLMVGDTNQLPPIEHGCPLRDFINAGIPCGELREIRRNAGTIVRICAAIRDGKPWRFDEELDPEAGQNLKLTRTKSNGESRERIVATLKKLGLRGLDPVWDCQVLVSVNAKSELSRNEMNRRLQAELNPDGEKLAGCPFWVGDKVIRVRRNTLMPVCDQAQPDENPDAVAGKVLICNGEQGQVVAIEPKRAHVRFPMKRFITIPFGKGSDDAEGEEATSTGCDFDLGYAITIHKSQGSEWPVVLLGLDDSGGAIRLGSRELLYTGISRGKRFGICYGKEETAKMICRKRAILGRKTFLAERITGALK